MTVPPRSVFAAAARAEVDRHDRWDAPNSFQTLHLDGDSLVCRTYACIMPDINPPDYPALMAKLAIERHDKDPRDPAYAYLLQLEGWGLGEPGPEASAAELAAYHAARVGRTFHEMPGAVETCSVWVADIHGRLWSAVKTRKHPDHVDEAFYRPGKAPGGQMITGLLAVAHATGIRYHGMPGVAAPGLN
jgi:hypothetical protein